jgi:hypothetical protein
MQQVQSKVSGAKWLTQQLKSQYGDMTVNGLILYVFQSKQTICFLAVQIWSDQSLT